MYTVLDAGSSNILLVDHTSTFNRQVMHIIHILMTWQHNICLCTVLLQQINAKSQHTRGSKYSLPILVTHLYRVFLLGEEISFYDRAYVVLEHISGTSNSCLHSV